MESTEKWLDSTRNELFALSDWKDAALVLQKMVEEKSQGAFSDLTESKKRALLQEVAKNFRTQRPDQFGNLLDLTNNHVRQRSKSRIKAYLVAPDTSMVKAMQQEAFQLASIAFRGGTADRLIQSLKPIVDSSDGPLHPSLRKKVWETILNTSDLQWSSGTQGAASSSHFRGTATTTADATLDPDHTAFVLMGQFESIILKKGLLGSESVAASQRLLDCVSSLFNNAAPFLDRICASESSSSAPPGLERVVHYLLVPFVYIFLAADSNNRNPRVPEELLPCYLNLVGRHFHGVPCESKVTGRQTSPEHILKSTENGAIWTKVVRTFNWLKKNPFDSGSDFSKLFVSSNLVGNLGWKQEQLKRWLQVCVGRLFLGVVPLGTSSYIFDHCLLSDFALLVPFCCAYLILGANQIDQMLMQSYRQDKRYQNEGFPSLSITPEELHIVMRREELFDLDAERERGPSAVNLEVEKEGGESKDKFSSVARVAGITGKALKGVREDNEQKGLAQRVLAKARKKFATEPLGLSCLGGPVVAFIRNGFAFYFDVPADVTPDTLRKTADFIGSAAERILQANKTDEMIELYRRWMGTMEPAVNKLADAASVRDDIKGWLKTHLQYQMGSLPSLNLKAEAKVTLGQQPSKAVGGDEEVLRQKYIKMFDLLWERRDESKAIGGVNVDTESAARKAIIQTNRELLNDVGHFVDPFTMTAWGLVQKETREQSRSSMSSVSTNIIVNNLVTGVHALRKLALEDRSQ